MLPQRTRAASLPLILLALMILAYAGFFAAYALQLHATLNTGPDLSAVDQPIWNALHGGSLKGAAGAPQHFAPILLPLSLVYLVWNDVRALLILQTLALAIGALPVFWIARRTFTGVTGDTGPADTRRAEWIALAFSAAYLLFPTLQAANGAGFHADALAVAPLLFAFWYGTEGRWRAMWPWAILVMAAGETLPALTAVLGLLLIFADAGFLAAWRGPARRSLGARLRAAWGSRAAPRSASVRHGLALFAVSAAWYLIAALIVAPHPPSAAGGLALLREPARLAYLTGLFASVGWLSLLAPEYLLLGLPVLLATLLAADPAAYSGAHPASAPLVAAFIIAAIYGARRLQRFLEKQIPFRFSPLIKNATLISALVVAWLLLFSLGAQRDRGWTPFARPFTWPATTDHARGLPRLLAHIPADAAVSATSAIHPHLAHREKVYVYPAMGDADYALVDVTDGTALSALDLRASVEKLLGEGFGIADAADGFILLTRGEANRTLPDDFYSFARATDPQPQLPVNAQFGPSLTLRGYDVIDDARQRFTRFRFYIDALQQPPADLTVHYETRSAAGEVVDDADLRPMPALVWRDPARWQAGETVVLETAGAYLPRSFAPVLRVTQGGAAQAAEVLPASAGTQGGPSAAQLPALVTEVASDGSLRLPGMARREGLLELWEGPLYPVETVDAAFGDEDWTVRLREWSAPLAVAPGGEVPILFYWQAGRPAPVNYHVFVHLRDATGRVVAQNDGPPTLFVARPVTGWQTGADGLAGGTDARMIRVPADVQRGQYEVVVGWFDPATGERLRRTAGTGRPSAGEVDRNAGGDEFVLGAITVDPGAETPPDTTCLIAKEACASLE